MDQSSNQSATEVERTLDREMNLIREAIVMVARGSSPRVMVGGLRFGETLLITARALATEAGVRLVPLWSADDSGADIVVERGDDVVAEPGDDD